MRLRACILAIAVVTPLRAFAQTPPAPPPEAAPPPPAVVVTPPEPTPPPPAPAAVAAAPMAPAAPAAPAAGPKFTWGGLVDTYYMYLFNPVDGANSLVGTTAPRQFDTNTNSATLALSAVTLNASMDPVAFQLDLGYGADGTIINAANGATIGPNSTMTSGVQGSFIVLQAYGTISLIPNLTLDFGKFYTTAGAEVVPANKNWLYSRSILFFNIPLLHTGARANFKVNDMLSLQASLVNGWNDDPDVNAWKTVGLSASITASPTVAITATTYIGKEAPQVAAPSTPADLRILADIVLALTLSDKLGVNVNFDFVDGPAPTNLSADYFVGIAAMARYVISDHLNVAARGEWARSHTDIGSVNADVMEGTVMLGIDVGKNFELRPEFRLDHNGQSIPFSNTGSSNQVTGTLAALTYF
jgi:hypothetical protein